MVGFMCVDLALLPQYVEVFNIFIFLDSFKIDNAYLLKYKIIMP